MPRGISKNTEGISKMEGVRRAVAQLGYDAAPVDIKKFLKKEFGINMDRVAISGYKSALKTAAKSAKIRKPGRPATVSEGNGAFSLDELRTVKQVVEKVGADKVRQLAEVLGK
jgi:hypothetical protein